MSKDKDGLPDLPEPPENQWPDQEQDTAPQDPNEGEYLDSDEAPDENLDSEAGSDESSDEQRKTTFGERIGDAKNNVIANAKQSAVDAIPGKQAVDEIAEKVQETASFTRNMMKDLKNIAEVVKNGFTAVANPVSLTIIGIIVVIVAILISIMAIGQVYGQTKTSSEGGASTAAGAMQQRLAQRAEWLQKHHTEYGGSSGGLWSSAPGPKSSISDNPWGWACPEIVAIIYGLSPYLVGHNGHDNAYLNWKAHPEMYDAYAFSSSHGNGQSSPGATLANPPAGAIVSIVYPPVGHTFVMLTDELVIDNYPPGGIGKQPHNGPRILSDGMRGDIVGWALPKSEGFEGSFLTGKIPGGAPDAPEQAAVADLPPVPTYMGDVIAAPADGGGGTYSGPAERAAWMKAAGIAESDWTYVDYIATKESSWNPKAVNSSSGASGLIQALPCSKVPGDCFDPVDNLRWANGYAKERYGSWKGAHEFWVANHWW